VFKFLRKGPQVFTFTGSAVSPQLGGAAFSLNQCGGYAEFTALFDSYRIERVDVEVINRISAGAQAAASSAYPRLHYCFDRDDSATPPSIDDLLSHQGVKTHQFDEGHNVLKFSIKPLPATAVFAAGVFSGYASPAGPMWVDCANVTVPHYGWKFATEYFTNTGMFLDVYYTFHVSFRDPR